MYRGFFSRAHVRPLLCSFVDRRFAATPSPVRSIRYNAYTYLGSDTPDVVDTGRPQNNIFRENAFIGGQETLKIKEADGTQFLDNTFVDATTIRFDDAKETFMSGNTGLDATRLKLANGACLDGESKTDATVKGGDIDYC